MSKIEKNADSVRITDSDNYLAYNEFVPLPQGIGICIKESARSSIEKAQIYFTYILTALSIVGYIWTSFNILVEKALRNVPNLNIVGLCFSLLCVDVISLTSPSVKHCLGKTSSTCYAFAVLYHWFLIQVQSWLVIITYEISSQFRHIISSRNIKSISRFVKYIAISSIFPTIMVIVLIVIDKTYGLIGYGGHIIVCWIESWKARLAAYVVPQLVVTCFTIIGLWYTVSHIKQQNEQNHKTLANENEKKNGINWMWLVAKLGKN